MSFKESFRKFIGIKSKEEEQKELTAQEKVKEFFEQLLFAAIAALIIISFVVQNTRIPTGSMENTILVGDFVLVNKFIYNFESPKYIPFTEIRLPYFHFKSFKDPKPKDIVVFEWPGDRDVLQPSELNVNYVKRCIGTPGDTIQVIDKVVYVNHKQFWIPTNILYSTDPPKPKGLVEPRIFPKGMPWNEDNWGPFVIPRKGDKIHLTINNVEQWRTIIDREYEKRVVGISGNTITIEGIPVKDYTFQKDYYFMMGDNRDDSYDSRFWGVVPRDRIVGEAFITLFSWDRDIPFTDFFRLLGSIRLERVLKILN